MSKEQAAAQLVATYNALASLTADLEKRKQLLTAQTVNHAQSVGAYLAASGGADEVFLCQGHLVTVKAKSVTVQPPSAAIIPITTAPATPPLPTASAKPAPQAAPAPK